MSLAVALVVDAFRDTYDRALLVTRDSDLAPAVRAVVQHFPRKRVVVVSPPGLGHSGELLRALPEKQRKPRAILRVHLERSLFPAEVVDRTGVVVAKRPAVYDPPAAAVPPAQPVIAKTDS